MRFFKKIFGKKEDTSNNSISTTSTESIAIVIPYEDGRVHSVTILSDHNNETNKEKKCL